MRYHPECLVCLTAQCYPLPEQCLAGSLSGADSSQIVTEEPHGQLSPNGNRADSVKAEAGLTARHTSRADTKVEFSEPTVSCRRAEDHRIKVTPGITG